MTTHPVIHYLHDVGLATWSGGSLMGAVGLNGAAAALDDPRERSKAATAGWSRWAPVGTAGLAAHVIGATGLLVTDLPRVRAQEGVLRSSVIKGAATAAAVGVAAWSAALNRTMARATPAPVAGATEPSASTPPEVARAQSQLKLVQWLNPLVSFGLIGLGAWHEEQQRAAQVTQGVLKGSKAPYVAGAAAAALALLAARRRAGSSEQPSSEATTTRPAPAPVTGAPTSTTTVRPAPSTTTPSTAPTGSVGTVDLTEVEPVIALDGTTPDSRSTDSTVHRP